MATPFEVPPTREQLIEKAAFALYEARRSEFPDAQPIAWDLASKRVRQDFRYLAMSAYRRSLPMVAEVLTELVAQNYANLEGWIYPDCDNRTPFSVPEQDRAAYASQRRQDFRRKAQELVASIFGYLEHDTDSEAQRKLTVERIEGQRQADVMIVSYWRSSRGMGQANHG